MNQEQLAALAKGLAPVVRECVAAATAPLLEQIDALKADVAALKGVDHSGAIAAAVTEAVAALPTPKDGADGKDADPAEIAKMVAEAVEALPKPEDGKSITVEDVAPLIAEQVTAAVGEAIKAIPVPRDGKDGVGVAGALIDRDGGLVLTLTDGTQRDLGAVVGKDGAPGKDGMDGLGFDDIGLVIAEDGVALKFTRGDDSKAFALPVPFYRGVFRAEKSYRQGNMVTWGGSQWTALKDGPVGKPDAPDSDWVLSTKKGRDASRHAAKVEV